ncbi:MAG TPA: signal peptidase I [Hyphomicrobiaceae bacterium]|nr:signal peptidase I [Hyphomicrobiaceae bacterium]
MVTRKRAPETWPEAIWDFARFIIYFALIWYVIRCFLFQMFNIPSGSMKETLLVGDYIVVSKTSYGYSRYSFPRIATLCIPRTDKCVSFRVLPDLVTGRVWAATPKRGDVAVFRLPSNTSTDYIKRVIGLPGETIQVKGGIVYIDGKAVPRQRVDDFVERDAEGRIRRTPRYEEVLPNGVKFHVLDEMQDGPFDDTALFKVPEGHYFMMGDNRDNSLDSRDQTPDGVGFVPLENFIGRANAVVISLALEEPWRFPLREPWRWPSDVRWGRFFSGIR